MLRKTLELIGIALAVWLLIVLIMTVVGLARTTTESVLILLPWLLGFIALATAWVRIAGIIKSRRAWTFLRTIEQAVRLNLPLPTVVRALGESEGGGVERDMEYASLALTRGEPVAEVLRALPHMPRRVVNLVQAAEHVGRLQQVLERIVRQRRETIMRRLSRNYFHLIYPLVLAAMFLGITSMILVFVMPKFLTIFHDFNTALPAITRSILWLGRDGGPWVAFTLMVILALFALLATWSWWVAPAMGISESMGERITNRLPWIGTIRMHRELGDVLEFTADAVESGQTIVRSLTEAVQITTHARLRNRLQRWVDEMVRGQTLPDAARQADMPPFVCGMLVTTVHTPDLVPALRFLGRYYITRFSRGLALLEASVLPVLAISSGLFVAWLAVSVVAAMVGLIQTVSVPAGGL